MVQSVFIGHYFLNPLVFPWDVMSLSRPYAAPLHSYLCAAAVLFCEPADRAFLIQHPALFELRRYGKESELVGKIAHYCDENNPVTCRFEKEKLVVEWLDRQHDFRVHMQKVLDSLLRQGLASFPDDAIRR